MSNINRAKASILDFYDHYAKKAFWSHEEAVALSLNINPRGIMLIDAALQDDEGNRYKQNFCTKYYRLMELVEEAMLSNIIPRKMSARYIINDIPRVWYPQAEPLSFINWCKDKYIPFPEELEKLVKKYTPDYVDWEARCEELESEIQELEIKNIKLTQEANSVPHTRRLNSWQKGFIGMMAVKYGYERLLSNFGDVYNKTEINDKVKLTYAKIRNDLNLQGISLDDEVIKELIQEAIKYLPHKSREII